MWKKFLTVALASTLKFIGGPIAGLALHLSWQQTAAVSLLGMMLSVVVFTYGGHRIKSWWQERIRHKKPRLFTRRNRRAVKIFQRFGMPGIAFLTPLLFTPIGGTLLAVSFHQKPYKILLWMAFFGALWAIAFSWGLYHIPWAKALATKV